MKESIITKHPVGTGAAVLAAALCAGGMVVLGQTALVQTAPVASGVVSTNVILTGAHNVQAGAEKDGSYYYSTKVSFAHIDLDSMRVELEEDGSWSLIRTTTGGITTRTPVYSEQDAESEVVCYLAPGTVVTAPQQETDQDWYEVYWGDLCGYVPADAVTMDLNERMEKRLAKVSEEYEESYGLVPETLTLYAEADETSDQLAEIAEGETVQLLAGQNGWYQVEYYGAYGYIKGDNVPFDAEKPEWKNVEELTALRNLVVSTAEGYMGCPYVWAASGPSSFDCSGFTMYIMSQFGVSLPHSAASQLNDSGYWVEWDQLEPGDLVFFRAWDSSLSASHVGIYIGDWQFIHASSGSGCVTINSLSDSWYAKTYVGAKRVIW